MADDNLVEAALGALEGFNQAFIPYQRRKYESDLLLQQKAKELELEQPYQLQKIRALGEVKTGLETQKETATTALQTQKETAASNLQTQKSEAAINLEQEKAKSKGSGVDGSKQPKSNPVLQKRIIDINSAIDRIETLKTEFKSTNKDSFSRITRILESITEKFPGIGKSLAGSLFPKTASFSSKVAPSAQSLALAITGASRTPEKLVEADKLAVYSPALGGDEILRNMDIQKNKLLKTKSDILSGKDTTPSISVPQEDQVDGVAGEDQNPYSNKTTTGHGYRVIKQ